MANTITKIKGVRKVLFLARDSLARATMAWINLRWRRRRKAGRSHALPQTLVVSLTSYAPRFGTLSFTLKCLLSQTLRPDVVVLWVEPAEADQLPPDVRDLQKYGLTIRQCAPWRSFKKIIPALAQYPDAVIVTADDDVYYAPTWLETLVDAHQRSEQPMVHGHRARAMQFKSDGSVKPYAQWPLARANEKHVFLTGVGGILYPPGILHPDVMNVEAFQALCPTSDDAWLYWMTRRNGRSINYTGQRRRLIPWPESQRVALQDENVLAGRNNEQFENLTRAFGSQW